MKLFNQVQIFSKLLSILTIFSILGISSALSEIKSLESGVKRDLSGIKDLNPLKIVFGSCIYNTDSRIWKQIRNQDPDLFLLLGDNIYLKNEQFTSINNIREAYKTHFNRPDFLNLINSVPTFAIWDDHDFGPDNSDSTFPFRSLSAAVFKEQWPNLPSPKGLSEGIPFKIELSNLDILMTDNRTFRVNPGGQLKSSYFGETQLNWIRSEILKSSKKLTIIVSGNQLLAKPGVNETLSQYPEEYKFFVDILQQSQQSIVLLSGDIHYAHLRENLLGDKLIPEVTSSPLAAMTRQQLISKQDEQDVDSILGRNNFGELLISQEGDHFKIKISLITIDGEKPIQRNYIIKNSDSKLSLLSQG